MKAFFTAACTLLCLGLMAQNPPQTQEQKEKQLLEYVDTEVKRLSDLLDLEYWQEFYVDSTLTPNYREMDRELTSMQKARVENTDLYLSVRDKWMERTDSTYRRIFNDTQWAKYWKNTGARSKKARDKRKK